VSPATVANLRDRVVAAVDSRPEFLQGLSRAVWQCHGLGWEEQPAVDAILSRVRELPGDIRVEEGVGGLATAFRVTVSSPRPGPHVATIAEYDAVAGIGQACGHNLISAATVGALVGVLSVLDDLNGRFSIYGTPAEETGGGKMLMEDAGVFDEIDALLMFHPKDINTVGQRSLTLIPLTLEFRGHAVHAAAFPHQGRNALDAMVNFYVGVSTLRQQLRMDARVHGIITDGGVTPANIPDYTRAEFLCRAADRPYAEHMVGLLQRIATAAAEMAGCEVAFPAPERMAYEAVEPDARLCALMRANVERLGMPLVEHEPILWASNDSGRMTQRIPTATLSLSIGEPPLGEHSYEFMEAAVSSSGDRALSDAAKVIALTAVDLMAVGDG
jgi:amidohydrolase